LTEGPSNNSSGSIAKDLAVLGSFLICGSLAGLLFAWLVTLPRLQEFFFIKGDKFLIPRYSYWFAFSLIQFSGLAAAYLVCSWRKWLVSDRGARVRLPGVVLIIALVTPGLRFATPLMNSRIGLNWDFVVAPIFFLILMSLALCLLTSSLHLLALALLWNLIFVAAGFVFVYAGVRTINGANEWYEFVQWPILEAMMALSFANWIIWRQRVDSRDGPEAQPYASRS
jgi:hypothetical protein